MYKLLKKSENGFSLLELVVAVAVAVAGIIAAVAVPTFIGLQGDATTEAASYKTTISGNQTGVAGEAGFWNGNGGSEATGTVISFAPGGILVLSMDGDTARVTNISEYVTSGSSLLASLTWTNVTVTTTSGTYVLEVLHDSGAGELRIWLPPTESIGSELISIQFNVS